MSRDDSCNSGALLSFLTGTVVGAAIALLVTPKTGRENRELLSEYGSDLKKRSFEHLPENVREQTETYFEQGREMIDHGRELISRGSEMVHQGKDYLEEKRQALNEAIEAGKQAMDNEKETLTENLEETEET